MKIYTAIVFVLISFIFAGCAPAPIKISDQHIQEVSQPKKKPLPIIQSAPMPELSTLQQSADVFTVVVNNVPTRELLFAIARDADVDIDISEDVSGEVTLNAIDQTFEQIIERISSQTDIRYKFQNGIFKVEKDSSYLEHYNVSYVNLQRTSEALIAISTEVASTGGSTGDSALGNTSSTSITNKSSHGLWLTLEQNIRSIIEENEPKAEVTGSIAPASTSADGAAASGEAGLDQRRVFASPESGLISVFATQRTQRQVKEYLDMALEGAQRQVFIEATIVEVDLNDDYQAGVDWSRLVESGAEGFSFSQALLGSNLATAPVTTLTYANPGSKYNLNASVKLLNQFGNAKVLSTPKLMVLNNQTALLKVVDNRIYFTIDVDEDVTEIGTSRTFTSEIHTVPVGLVMSVTPQISPENEITLNVRPTISRILQFVEDPNPALVDGNVKSLIPEISVREIESILRVKNGDIAVIGGLMQDNHSQDTDGLPGLSKLPFIGDAFSYKDNQSSKSELVIFLKPITAQRPTLGAKFAKYKRFLDSKKTNTVLGN
jgi:general secretion pathway protein D